MNSWQRWIRQPQTVWLRKATFQLHLWSGIGIGLYLLLVSVTGSVLVWRNELAAVAERDPIIVAGSGPRLTDEQLRAAAARAYPGYPSISISRPPNPDEAVEIHLQRGEEYETRLFDPYTGEDLDDKVSVGTRLINQLIDLHDNLLAGTTGRNVNGVGALLLVVLAFTGAVVWWPGIKSWRRSLTVHRHVGWRRFTWELHSMTGFWAFGFIVLFGISGVYLGNPEPIQNLADTIDPMTDANAGERISDWVLYWLAFLHFGRIGGIAIPCTVRSGLCDWAWKGVWTFFGLAPAVMFVTGAVMWWNRVVRKKTVGQPSRLRRRAP